MGSEEKQKAPCRRVRDPGVEKETSFPHLVVQGKGSSPRPKLTSRRLSVNKMGVKQVPEGTKHATYLPVVLGS